MSCQNCGGETTGFLDLGRQPICNAFLKSPAEFKSEKFYPMEMAYCDKCHLVQLKAVPPRNLVFGPDFNYLTGSYPEAVAHFRGLSDRLVRELRLKTGDYVVDLASNDGTFLRPFAERGISVLGVDPAPKPAAIAAANGIETVVRSFEDAVDEVARKVKGRLRLVTALNVMAHTDRIHGFLDGVKRLCKENNAVFVSQSHYLVDMVEKAEWDMSYFEHARFLSATSLVSLLGRHGLYAYDSERTPYLGGSFITSACDFPVRPSPRLSAMIDSEQRKGFNSLRIYKDFAREAAVEREWLQNCLMEIRTAGKRVAGVGAPMKSATLLTYCGIDSRTLEYLTELNPLKVGTWSPGSHIHVDNEERIFKDPPDYLMVLAWNVAERIMQNLRTKGYAGKFIIPVPRARVENPPLTPPNPYLSKRRH